MTSDGDGWFDKQVMPRGFAALHVRIDLPQQQQQQQQQQE